MKRKWVSDTDLEGPMSHFDIMCAPNCRFHERLPNITDGTASRQMYIYPSTATNSAARSRSVTQEHGFSDKMSAMAATISLRCTKQTKLLISHAKPHSRAKRTILRHTNTKPHTIHRILESGLHFLDEKNTHLGGARKRRCERGGCHNATPLFA